MSDAEQLLVHAQDKINKDSNLNANTNIFSQHQVLILCNF
jgi:hypothetical protein